MIAVSAESDNLMVASSQNGHYRWMNCFITLCYNYSYYYIDADVSCGAL